MILFIFFLLWCDFLNLFYRLNLKYTRHIKRSDIEATIVCRKAIRWLQETWMRLRPWWRKWLWNFKKRILKYGNGWFPICFMLLSCMWLCYPSLIVLFLKKSCVFFSDLVFPIITQIMRSQGSCVLIQGVFFQQRYTLYKHLRKSKDNSKMVPLITISMTKYSIVLVFVKFSFLKVLSFIRIVVLSYTIVILVLYLKLP